MSLRMRNSWKRRSTMEAVQKKAVFEEITSELSSSKEKESKKKSKKEKDSRKKPRTMTISNAPTRSPQEEVQEEEEREEGGPFSVTASARRMSEGTNRRYIKKNETKKDVETRRLSEGCKEHSLLTPLDESFSRNKYLVKTKGLRGLDEFAGVSRRGSFMSSAPVTTEDDGSQIENGPSPDPEREEIKPHIAKPFEIDHREVITIDGPIGLDLFTTIQMNAHNAVQNSSQPFTPRAPKYSDAILSEALPNTPLHQLGRRRSQSDSARTPRTPSRSNGSPRDALWSDSEDIDSPRDFKQQNSFVCKNFLLYRKPSVCELIVQRSADKLMIRGAPREVLLEATFTLVTVDWDYIKRFLLVYRYFYPSPYSLWEAYSKEFGYAPPPDSSSQEKTIYFTWGSSFQERIANIIHYWIQNFSADFDETLLSDVHRFFSNVASDKYSFCSTSLLQKAEGILQLIQASKEKVRLSASYDLDILIQIGSALAHEFPPPSDRDSSTSPKRKTRKTKKSAKKKEEGKTLTQSISETLFDTSQPPPGLSGSRIHSPPSSSPSPTPSTSPNHLSSSVTLTSTLCNSLSNPTNPSPQAFSSSAPTSAPTSALSHSPTLPSTTPLPLSSSPPSPAPLSTPSLSASPSTSLSSSPSPSPSLSSIQPSQTTLGISEKYSSEGHSEDNTSPITHTRVVRSLVSPDALSLSLGEVFSNPSPDTTSAGIPSTTSESDISHSDSSPHFHGFSSLLLNRSPGRSPSGNSSPSPIPSPRSLRDVQVLPKPVSLPNVEAAAKQVPRLAPLSEIKESKSGNLTTKKKAKQNAASLPILSANRSPPGRKPFQPSGSSGSSIKFDQLPRKWLRSLRSKEGHWRQVEYSSLILGSQIVKFLNDQYFVVPNSSKAKKVLQKLLDHFVLIPCLDSKRGTECTPESQYSEECFYVSTCPLNPFSLGVSNSAVPLLLNTKPREIAEQLTIFESHLFSMIRLTEFHKQSWTKGNVKQSFHLLATIQLFNRLSHWVATEVVTEINDVTRKLILQHFLKIAWHLRAIQNYNTLFAIVCGMELVCVSRLKLTWKNALSSEKWRSRHVLLLQETSPEGNYPIYRAWLKTAEKSDKFCIPYLGVFLRDLTLSEEGNMSFLHDDVINWERACLVSDNLIKIDYFQKLQTKCPYKVNPEIQNYIARGMSCLDSDEELYRLSRLRESKVRLKTNQS